MKGLNVELIQVTGDEAGGLTSAVTNLLGVHKSSDLFHIQQEITKGLTSHLARRIERGEKELNKCENEKEETRQEMHQRLEKPGATIDDPGVVKSGRKMIKAQKKIEACHKQLENAKKGQKTAQEARRGITKKGYFHKIVKG